MKRELAILLGVLVPFGALVWLAVRAPLPVEVPGPSQPPPVAKPLPTAQPALDAGERLVVAPVEAVDAGRPRPVPRELAAALGAVTPQVQLCVSDQRAHLDGPQRIDVHFTPLPDGGFAQVRVASTANPWVGACVEDVFDEVPYTPSGAETFRPAQWTFELEP